MQEYSEIAVEWEGVYDREGESSKIYQSAHSIVHLVLSVDSLEHHPPPSIPHRTLRIPPLSAYSVRERRESRGVKIAYTGQELHPLSKYWYWLHLLLSITASPHHHITSHPPSSALDSAGHCIA